PEDVAGVRFAMAPRGYRMAEVDEVLDRLAAELADRDRRLALLEATITGVVEPVDAPAVDVVEAGEQDLPIVGATTGERPAPPSGAPLSTWPPPPYVPVAEQLPAEPLPADPGREDLR
ncbi:MAG: DivIVA domain-containing protein, partial [Frankiales bacterium]|nr:DivIVA domain-containing protein [Frankiales bacterium]